MKDKLALIVASVAVVIAIGGYMYPTVSDMFGASGTRFPNGISTDSTSPTSGQVRGTTFTATGSLTLGSSGTAHSKFLSGTCNLGTSGTASFTASTTLIGYCSATGVAASDKCFAVMPGNDRSGVGSAANNGVFLTGRVVATTTDQLGIELINQAGVATTSYAQATTSVTYFCADN